MKDASQVSESEQPKEDVEPEQKANDNSLDTEEDLENYLEKLEEEDRRKRLSSCNGSSGHHEGAEQNINSISKISKSSGQKDMIDVIEEVEGEDDENFLDNDESFTKEFYQVMH